MEKFLRIIEIELESLLLPRAECMARCAKIDANFFDDLGVTFLM